MTDAEIINKVLQVLELTPTQLANELGIKKPDGIYHIINGRYGLSDKMSDKLIRRFPQLSEVFLKTGHGNVLNEDYPSTLNEPNLNYHSDPLLTSKDSDDMESKNITELIELAKFQQRDIHMMLEIYRELVHKLPNYSGLGEGRKPIEANG